MRMVTPEGELPKMTRNARIFLAALPAPPCSLRSGGFWLLWFLLLPRLLGMPVMMLFTLIQHVEMQENSPVQSWRVRARSGQTGSAGSFTRT